MAWSSGPLDADGDTAVISTFMWKPPSGIADNVYQNDREQTLVDGPIADVITSLHDSGRSVVVTGHSAGGAAVQTLLSSAPTWSERSPVLRCTRRRSTTPSSWR